MIGHDRAREVLAHYRDRTIHAIGEARAIGCVTDECRTLFDTTTGFGDEIDQVVDGLCGVLWTLQRALDRADAGRCGHDEVHPYVPEGRDYPISGISRCDACDEVLVEVKCRGCDVEMLPHQMPAHLAERCWAS